MTVDFPSDNPKKFRRDIEGWLSKRGATWTLTPSKKSKVKVPKPKRTWHERLLED